MPELTPEEEAILENARLRRLEVIREQEEYRENWLAEEQQKIDDLAAAGVVKTEAERASKAAWQAALDVERGERPARVAGAQQNRLTARKAAEDKARNERAEAAKEKAHGRP